jgi:hypothetical protein
MADTEYMKKITELYIEAELDGRRVHLPDVEQAAEMAAERFRSVLESRGYTVRQAASYTYGYRDDRVEVGG